MDSHRHPRMQGLYKIAGVKGQPVCFIFSDAEVKDDAFLEYINQLLMTGEIAGLFAKDELDAIVNDIRPAFRAECHGVPDTWDNLYAFFISRVRDRLHVVLCFSPVGNKFSRWAQQVRASCVDGAPLYSLGCQGSA